MSAHSRKSRRSRRPALELLEDRLTPSVPPDFSGGVLTLTLDAPNDQVFLQRFNNKIDVGTSDGGKDVVAGQAGVTSIVVKDGGTNSGQAVTFSNHGAAYPQTITLQGIETANLYRSTDHAVSGDADVVNVFAPETRNGTIRNGVGLVASGGTVNVGPGTYRELVTITKPLTLVGDPGDSQPGPGANAPTLDGATVGAGARGITILGASGAHNVTIRGFRFANWVATASGYGGNGILGKGVANVTLEDNAFLNTGGSAILAAEAPNATWTVRRNDVENAGGYSIQLDYMAGNVLVEQNFVDTLASAAQTLAGMLVLSRSSPGPAVTIRANDFEGNLKYAIYLDAAGGTLANPLVENNEIRSFSTGVWVVAPSSGTLSGTLTGLVIRGNAFAGTNAVLNQTTAPVNASLNWGTPLEAVVNQVDYSPYFINGNDTSSTPGFQGDLSALGVVTLPTRPNFEGPLGQVAEGVLDAAPGGSVFVNVGHYMEDFTADRNVTIKLGNVGQITPAGGKVGMAGNFEVYPGFNELECGGLPSTLTITGNLTLNPNPASVIFRMNTATDDPNFYDRIVVTGTVTLNNPLLLYNAEGVPVGRVFTVIRNDSSTAIQGQFDGAPEGHVFHRNALGHTGDSVSISYLGGADQNDVLLTKVAS